MNCWCLLCSHSHKYCKKDLNRAWEEISSLPELLGTGLQATEEEGPGIQSSREQAFCSSSLAERDGGEYSPHYISKCFYLNESKLSKSLGSILAVLKGTFCC